jgi:hypothetical protein
MESEIITLLHDVPPAGATSLHAPTADHEGHEVTKARKALSLRVVVALVLNRQFVARGGGSNSSVVGR